MEATQVSSILYVAWFACRRERKTATCCVAWFGSVRQMFRHQTDVRGGNNISYFPIECLILDKHQSAPQTIGADYIVTADNFVCCRSLHSKNCFSSHSETTRSVNIVHSLCTAQIDWLIGVPSTESHLRQWHVGCAGVTQSPAQRNRSRPAVSFGDW